ncbi:MAG TPA: hypothetical protein VLD55_03630 [Candidatus Sulfobium mesophilum]|nr:hypothetical protein [Candidatus Sulfobium mesophilum]
MKTSLLVSERKPAGTFHQHGKVFFAGLIFFVLYFALADSSLNAAGTPVGSS